MIHRARAAALLLGAPLGALALSVLLAPAASAAVPTVIVTFSQATPTQPAAVTPTPAKVVAGGSVTFDNTKGTANLTITGTLAGSKPIVIQAKSRGAIAVPASTKSSTLTYTASEPPNPVSVLKTSADGMVSVTGVAAPGSSAAPSAPSGGGGTAVAGQPSAGGPTGQPSGGAPGVGGGQYVGPGLPGGVIAPLAPGATAYPNGPAPLVAPFATATATAAPFSPTEPGAPDASSSGPAAVAASSTPSGRSGTRSLGLPAAITAVALVGVIAALIRVLLTHPAARAIPRRH